jgi:hypothetical protein
MPVCFLLHSSFPQVKKGFSEFHSALPGEITPCLSHPLPPFDAATHHISCFIFMPFTFYSSGATDNSLTKVAKKTLTALCAK